MTGVICRVCESKHYFTPTALALLLMAYQDGEGHRVTVAENGAPQIASLCSLEVAESIKMDDPRREKFRGVVDFVR